MSRENNKLPRLRFPEFRDAGDWEEKRLGEVATFANHRVGISKILLEQFVSTESLLPDYGGIKIATKLPPDGTAILFKKGDILISNIRPYLKKVWFSNKSGGTSNDVIVVRARKTGFSRYLSFVLINDSFINYVMESAKGVKMPRGDINQIKEFPVAFPKDEQEQQKIADCLSSLDDLITAQTQKLAHLKIHKKGLMQQLFPAEGETQPKLRFPEFRNAGNWEEKEGNLVFEQISNKKHDSNLPVLAITQEYGAIPRVLIDFHVSVTDKSIKNYKVVEEGDFIISLRTFQGGIEHSKYKGICSPAYVILRKSQSNSRISISGGFFKYYFKTGKFIRDLSKNIEGLRDGKMVSYKQFSALMLPIPLVEEQQKIADCLSSLDDLISAQGQKLAHLKTHKKGLMQQLFPATGEVNK